MPFKHFVFIAGSEGDWKLAYNQPERPRYTTYITVWQKE